MSRRRRLLSWVVYGPADAPDQVSKPSVYLIRAFGWLIIALGPVPLLLVAFFGSVLHRWTITVDTYVSAIQLMVLLWLTGITMFFGNRQTLPLVPPGGGR